MHIIVNFVDTIEIYKNAHTYRKAKIKPLTGTQWRSISDRKTSDFA